MFADEESFYRRCIRNGIVLDTNILVAFLVGKYAGEDAVEKHGRAKYCGYIKGDYSVLDWIVAHARKIITTRYILSQVSDLYPLENYYNKGKKYNSDDVVDNIPNIIIEDCSSIVELSRRNYTKQFGYADASIIELSSRDYAIVTLDSNLLGVLYENGACAVSMDRLRAMFVGEKNSLSAFR